MDGFILGQLLQPKVGIIAAVSDETVAVGANHLRIANGLKNGTVEGSEGFKSGSRSPEKDMVNGHVERSW